VGTTETALKPRSGLLTAIDIIIAPQAAFERIAVAPTWAWALLLTIAVSVMYSFVTLPAAQHVVDASVPQILAHNAQIASLPAAEQPKQIARIMGFYHFFVKINFIVQPFSILITALLQTVALLVINIAAKGKANFSRLWSLTANISVVGYGVTLLVMMLVIVLRGPEAFDSLAAIVNTMPGLGLLAPPDAHVLGAFLAPFNVTNIWASVLFVIGMRTIAGIKTVPAIIGPVLMMFTLAIISAGNAAQAQ
jgi:hypothetical protein